MKNISYLRRVAACLLICTFFLIPVGVVVADSVTIDSDGIDTLMVGVDDMLTMQTAQEMIINWDSFDIDCDSIEFSPPTVSAAVLNRVLDGDLTSILGSLSTDGHIFIVNPDGILFGNGLTIDTVHAQGEDWTDATPIPEPCSLALLGLGGLLLRKRRA